MSGGQYPSLGYPRRDRTDLGQEHRLDRAYADTAAKAAKRRRT